MTWFRSSADAGNAVEMRNVAMMYRTGNGVLQDFVQAKFWPRRSTDAGYPDAMFDVGFMYDNAKGVSRDDAQAMTSVSKGG